MAGYHVMFCKDAFPDTEVIVAKGTAREMKGSQTGGADSDNSERGGRKMS